MNNMKEKLKEVTKRSDEEVAVIDEILNSHFVMQIIYIINALKLL